MSTAFRFRRDYAAAFAEHLQEPGERTLHAAYELGRRAVADDLSVLELADAHHDALAAALGGAALPHAQQLAVTAGGFFSETLSAYEMVQRGYREAREAAAQQSRHAQTIRRLSTFLADASLASDATEASGEVLQLVAEEARELVAASCCIVAIRSTTGSAWTARSSPAELIELLGPRRDAQFLAVHALLEATGGPCRLRGDAIAEHGQLGDLPGAPVASWLGVPLTALDRRMLGWIQLFEWELDGPTDIDEALIMHLAQMAAATLERALLYQR